MSGERGDMSQLHARVIKAAIALERATSMGYNGVMEIALVNDAVRALQAQREQDADVCTCPRDRNPSAYCKARECQGGLDVCRWELRTWRDVRLGDIVRAPCVPGTESEVRRLGPVNHWHTEPNEDRWRRGAEWSSIDVTLRPTKGGAEHSPPYGMKPDANVEILVTAAEMVAIELLGGWEHRVAVHEKNMTS